MEIYTFEETIMKYLLFLVHVQQSVKIPIQEKVKVFDLAKEIANSIFSNVQSYLSNKNEYNSYDKDKILSKAFNEIKTKVEKELNSYKRNITINGIDFSYYKIIDTLTDTKYNISLTRNDIKQILSYNDLTKNIEKEKIQNKQLEDLKLKNEKEFYEIRKKAFCSMLHGNQNINPMRFFEINDYILVNYNKENIKYLHDQASQIKEGVYCIETPGERIIKLHYEKRIIEYSFRIIDLNDSFAIYIQGYIKINDSKEEFYINEKYLNSQFGNVMNAYNLKKVMDLFNEFGREEHGDNNNNGTNDIDDFLSGRIK
ncbi:hypothetical protein AGMMS50293_05610 [Spirochaetia bacterium]|nr:hypothetical protein AGMMS50293_05610 [Spirochaetia bacterium]